MLRWPERISRDPPPDPHGDEIAEAPAAVARQAQGLAHPLRELVACLERRPPQVVVTCARGSSAHAATFGKHLIERIIGTPVAAAAPNIASVYGRQLNLRNQLFLAISQSGKSDDLIAMALSARAAGALTVAVLNVTDSPLARACDLILPIGAGPETSVAASKTFVATLTALQRLVAAWTDDAALVRAVDALPERLTRATDLDWSAATGALSRTRSLVTIGRGPTLAIAREASLKLKETCNLHAEAFSGAEFLHGPVALAAPTYPILMFMPTDAAAVGMRGLAADLRGKGTALFATEPGELGVRWRRPERDGCPRFASTIPRPTRYAWCRASTPCCSASPSASAPTWTGPAFAEGDANAMTASARHADCRRNPLRRRAGCHRDCTVVIEGEVSSRCCTVGSDPQGLPRFHAALPDGIWLAPGFIDCQVNGGGDVLFNDAPTPEAIDRIAAAHRRLGTTGAAADADQRHAREDAGRAERRAPSGGVKSGRPWHPSGRAVPLAAAAGRAQPGRVPYAQPMRMRPSSSPRGPAPCW